MEYLEENLEEWLGEELQPYGEGGTRVMPHGACAAWEWPVQGRLAHTLAGEAWQTGQAGGILCAQAARATRPQHLFFVASCEGTRRLTRS